MDTDTLIAALGWALAALSSIVALPQLTRLIRRRTSEGVSLLSTLGASVTMWAWCCYTWVERDIPAFASSVGPLIVWVGVVTVVVFHRRDARSVLYSAGAVAFMALTLFSGYAMHIATIGSVVWIIPQGVAALRSEHLGGVSAAAYMLIFFENVGWILYGVSVGRYVYAVAPVVQIPMSVAIVLRSRRHARRALEPADNTAGADELDTFPATMP